MWNKTFFKHQNYVFLWGFQLINQSINSYSLVAYQKQVTVFVGGDVRLSVEEYRSTVTWYKITAGTLVHVQGGDRVEIRSYTLSVTGVTEQDSG